MLRLSFFQISSQKGGEKKMEDIEREDRILKEIKEILEEIRNKLGSLESGLSQLSTKIDANHIDIQLQLSRSKVEMYRIEAQGFLVNGRQGCLNSPFKIEIAPQSVGNSPIDPDYEIFLDRDYGI